MSALVEYCGLIGLLGQVDSESAEAEEIREVMDDLWLDMNASEQETARKVSAEMNRVEVIDEPV